MSASAAVMQAEHARACFCVCLLGLVVISALPLLLVRVSLTQRERVTRAGFALNRKDFFKNISAIITLAVVGTIVASMVRTPQERKRAREFGVRQERKGGEEGWREEGGEEGEKACGVEVMASVLGAITWEWG